MEAESAQALGNIRAVLEANGLTLKDVVKCTVMLADIAEWGQFNEVYKEFFSPLPGAQRLRRQRSRPGSPGRARVHGRVPLNGRLTGRTLPGLSFARQIRIMRAPFRAVSSVGRAVGF
jgi:hypothetical protein